jgi:hypothetical protein
MILITEDAMKNFEQVAITLQWLYLSQGGQPKGRKMLLFPHILDWIERRVKDPRLVQQHKWYGSQFLLLFDNS